MNEQIDLAGERPFRLGFLEVEPGLRQIRLPPSETAVIEPRVMQVLIALMRSRDTAVSRARLQELCWSGRTVSDDALDRVIARIRRLSESIGRGSFTIETIPRVGYCLRPNDGEPTVPTNPGASRRSVLIAGGEFLTAVGAGAGALYFRAKSGARGAGVSTPLTIAVLPFEASADDPNIGDFARQLTEEIRADLSRVTGLRVIAETSSRSAAGQGGSAHDIGGRLGADMLLEGDVAARPNVEVRVSLVDVDDERQLWSTAASRPLGRRGDLRTQISGAVMQQLAALIPSTAIRAAPPLLRQDPQAYLYVSEANRLLEEIRTTAMRGKREEALERGDRAYAFAQRALAINAKDSAALLVLAAIARNGWTRAWAAAPYTTEQRVQQSITYVRRALLANPNDAGAVTQLGDYYRRYGFRWDEAENLFRRALAIDPNLVDAHWSYAYELGVLGRALEGLSHALSVFELDPRNPYRRVALPRLLYLVGQRGAAMHCYDREIAQQPDNVFLLRELYYMFLSEGNSRALDALGKTMQRLWFGRVQPTAVKDLSARVSAGAAALGGQPRALRMLIDAEMRDYDAPASLHDATPQGRARDDLPYIFAIENAWAGRTDEAVDMLDRALAGKSLYWPPTLPYGQAPFPAAVRQHPRYAGLWQRDPGLRELLARRSIAVRRGQLDGYTAQGTHVVPRLDGQLAARVGAALARV